MKRLVVSGLSVILAVPAMAIDITAAVRAANAATVTRIEGTAYGSGKYDVAALFDGSQASGETQRWLEKQKPTAESPIIIQYDIDENFWLANRAGNVVVKSFTLYNSYNASSAKTRAPKAFSLSASYDGTTAWTTLCSASSVTNWAANSSDTAPRCHTFEIPASLQGTYRHFRLTITANNGDSYTSASELVLEGDFVPFAAEGATSSVFADAAFWFRGATDLDGDGILDDGELSNALRLGLPDDSSHGCTIRGAADEAQIQRVTVNEPYRSASVETDVIALCPPIENDNGTWKMQSGYVEPTGCTLVPTNVGPYSAVMRVWVENPTSNGMMSVSSFGYEYSRTNGVGLIFSFSTGRERFFPLIAFGGGKNLEFKSSYSLADSKYNLMTNKWIDIAITLGDGKITVYTCGEGGALMVETKDIPSGLGTTKPSYALRLGGSSYSESKTAISGACSMVGRIAQVAVWGRCLGYEEVCAAFGAPRPDLMCIGVPNGSSAEFAGGTSAATSAEGKTGCDTMPRSLTAENPSVEISFNAAARDTEMMQVLRVKTANRAGAGRLSASLNGTVVGEADYAAFDTVSLLVPRDLVQEGANTLTLTRLSGGALDIDTVALGGSICIGNRNGAFYDVFNRSNRKGVTDAFDTYSGNFADVVLYVMPAGYNVASSFSNMTFRVHVDPAIAALGCRHRFTTKLRQTHLDGGVVPVRVELDGATMCSGDIVQKNTAHEFSFTVSGLSAGDHLISCINGYQTPDDIPFEADYYMFQLLKPPAGSMIIVR